MAELKERKEFCFCKLNIKDQCFLQSNLCNDKKIFTCSQKSVKLKKECLHLFNKKKTPLYAELGSKQKNFLTTVKQLIRKKSDCCLEIQVFFFTEWT